jgi:hypothetical protein
MSLMQVLIFGHIQLFSIAFCFAYITVLVSLPVNNGRIINMLIAFAMGAFVDAFNYTMGISAFCAVTYIFFRQNLYGLVQFQSKEEQEKTMYTLRGVGTWNFTMYVLVSSLFFTTMFYFIMSPGWIFFWKNLLRIACSTVLSTVVIVCINFLFFRKDQTL